MQRLLIGLLLAVSTVSAQAQWLTGWTYRKEITIPAASVTGSHTDFPVLVNRDGDTDLRDKSLTNGHDVCFTASDGSTQLSHRRMEHVRLAVDDACRTWFGGPFAVHHAGTEDKTYFSWCDSLGSLWIGAYDHTTDSLDTPFELASGYTADDHRVPSIFVRSDGKILVFYGYLGDTAYCRLSTNAEDISAWGTAVSLGTDKLYFSPVEFSDGTLRLYHRQATGSARTYGYIDSSDGGATWGSFVTVFDNGGTTRPYFQIAQDGDVVHFFCTNDNPNIGLGVSLYHFQYDHADGNYDKADGTLIGGSGALPLDTADVQLIRSWSVGGRCWTGSAAVDATGHPVLAYFCWPTSNTYSVCNVGYLRWDGSAWDDTTVVDSGSGLAHDQEPFYPGGVALGPSDPDVLYISRNDDDGGRHIYKYETADSGATFTATQISQDKGDKNFRPIVPVNAHADLPVIWLYGSYQVYTDFDCGIRLGGAAGESVGDTFRAEYYVEVPSVTDAADTTIYMYYGHAAASDQQDTVSNVFGANLIDLGRGDCHRASFGSVNMAGWTEWTMELRLDLDESASAFKRMAGNYVASQAFILPNTSNDGNNYVRCTIRVQGSDVGGGFNDLAMNVGAANRVELLFKSSDSTGLKARLNGTQSATTYATGTAMSSVASTAKMFSGQSANQPDLWHGKVETFRLWNVQKSADFLATSRTNESNLSTFAAVGTEETDSGDMTAPTLVSATIGATGDTITLVFDEAVTGNAGFTLNASGGAVTMTYDSGSGTDTLVYNLSRPILQGETVTLTYTP